LITVNIEGDGCDLSFGSIKTLSDEKRLSDSPASAFDLESEREELIG